jgi:sugar phosphate isomerase/epimerase
MDIGLQLYGLRDSLAQDYAAGIARVAKIGFTGVELFGDFLTAAEHKALTDSHGLKVVGHHFVIHQLEADLQACIDRALGVGSPIVICAWANAEGRDWNAIADVLEGMGQACAAHNLSFAYHNHDHELLETVNGKPALDVIAERAPSVKLEVDVAWVHAGKFAPSVYLEKYASRIPLVHIKDVKAKAAGGWDTVELGSGDVDLIATVAAAKKTVSPWLIAEQDHSDDPWRSTENNFAWLKKHA